ncbi:hypothetical protein C8J56DRAFT_909719 [Mycena floridula]|nr:hypothetical protein C8J56DRAFT_909691 [Mycena floridula]KAJ7600225.1 hypothetical protein C8J56DRAFT_909719 [Mycena floridula]
MSALIKPVQLGPVTLKNRVFLSALTRSRSVPTNIPNDLNREYYKQRSNAGLIVTEGTLIAQQGTEWPNAPGIWNKEQVAGWKKITDQVHAEGSVIYVQLWHVGRVAHPDMPEQIAAGRPVYAPSAIAAKGGEFRQLPGSPGYVTPTAVDDPTTLIADFKQAAINAKAAGFDGVELHGANGYLVHQFLDSTSNNRTDKWGGSIENRSRFGLETLKVLIEVFGSDRVAIKLSPSGGYNDMGMPLQETLDTFSYFITEADKLKLSYICLARPFAMLDPTGRGTAHDVVESYRHLIKHAKAFYGADFTPEEAAALVESGKADGVFFGRLFIPHPDLAKRIESGKPLNNQIDWTRLYGTGKDEATEAKGYTDYPAATYA